MRSRIFGWVMLSVLASLTNGCAEARIERPAAASPVAPAPQNLGANALPDVTPEAVLANANEGSPPEPAAAVSVPAGPTTVAEGGFRERVRAEMDVALGKPARSRQDAVNAAYQRIGWRPGTAPTEKQNRLAYHQAMTWGATLGRLARGGRDEPLTSADIADGPLRKEDLTVLDAAPGHGVLLAAPSETIHSEREPPSTLARAESETPETASARAAVLAQLTQRVNKLHETARALDQQVSSLERGAANPISGAKAGSVRGQSARLEEIARNAELSASSLEQEVRGARQVP